MASPLIISIEGNIGSGKSTLLRELKARNPDWQIIDEPVDQWLTLKNERGECLLELFYKDKRRWAYTFQNTALLTRIQSTREAIQRWEAAGRPGKGVFITERCVQTDANVFAKLMRDDGEIDDLEWTLYKKWYDAFGKTVPEPSAYIHVDTPVTVCHERILKRGRDGEGGTIPVEYLDKLDTAHFRWLRDWDFKPAVMRVDNASKDRTRIEIVEEWVKSQWLHSVE